MVKIDNKRKLKFYLRDYERGNISQKSAAETLGITSRRFRQIYEIYKSTGSVPIIGLKLGRPMKEVPEEWKEIIKQEYEKYRQNALYQEDTIFARCKIRIPHNTIHKVMLEFGFAREQEKKQKRRKPWIRIERNGKQLCSILDDASRKVLAAGEFDNATEENSLKVMTETIEKNSHMYPIISVMWYNDRPHRSLNLRRAETPNVAFIRKMPPEVWLGFAIKTFGW